MEQRGKTLTLVEQKAACKKCPDANSCNTLREVGLVRFFAPSNLSPFERAIMEAGVYNKLGCLRRAQLVVEKTKRNGISDPLNEDCGK